MPTITGTAGNDTLTGTAASDLIQGLGGNDILTDTLGGDDVLDGGDDDDLIVVTRAAGGTHEQLLGGNGNDILRFTGARDAEDLISGGAGADMIEATGFGFVVDGGSGDDAIYIRKSGGGNAPTVTLGPGQDTIGFLGNNLGAQIVVVTDFTPGDGGDRIDWGATLAYLVGWDQSGNPFASGYLSFVQSGDIVAIKVKTNPPADGGNVFFFSGFDPSALTAFNLGGYASDGSAPANLNLAGTAAADTLNGGNGNDTITGGAGNDVLNGGVGHDEIHGGADNDTIDGWLGTDTIFGDGGDDVIVDDYGFRGTIDGGTGNDTITTDISKHPSLPLVQPAAPVMFARTIDGGDGDDRITVIGYSDSGSQRTTEATINGGADNDVIDVGNSAATIDAGTGDDLVIIRGAVSVNAATVTLGAGVDTLRLTNIPSSNNIAAVTVTDFATGPGGDVVDIPALVASRGFGWDYQGNPFAGGFVRLIASGADTLLQGNGSNGYLTLAIFQGVAPAAFTTENLGGFDPSGAPPAPQVITGTPNDDTLDGGLGNDTVSGLAGDDILTGGFGNDTLNGGDDDDHLDGQWANDTLNGGDGNDVLTDTLGGTDIMNGGDGDDILTDALSGDDTLNGGNGNDIITATRGSTGSSTFSVDGGDGNDIITLERARGNILGGAGNDVIVIDGTGFNLIVDGGSGDDDITVDAATIFAGAGNDIVRSDGGTQDLTLGAGKDTVLIQGDETALTIQDFQVGEEGDRLDLTSFGANPFGLNGNLIIDQLGADTRIRSKDGHHTFLLENVTAADLSTYNLGVPTGFFNPAPRSFTGTPGPDTYISADGNDNLSGLGDDDTLYGAGGNDVIDGGAGEDSLYGGTGNDFIDGGTGADFMAGGAGNDTFIVDDIDDEIVENSGEGRDVVYARSSYTLAAGVSVEVLSAVNQAATTAMELVGNALDQEIYGNAGANFLQGGGGTDYLFGYGGDDVYLVAGAGDHIFESAGGGRDVVYALANYTLEAGQEIEVLSAASQAGTTPLELIGNGLGQEIYGNAGANFLQGGGGTDYLFGLGGNDTYLVAGASERVFEGAGGGRDVVYAQASFTLEAGQEIEILSAASQAGTGALTLIGNGLGQEIYGNAGANFLQGGGGADYLFGFGGNDVYLVSGASEHVFEGAGGGRDVVYAQASYALDAGQEIEVLSTTSQAAATAIDLTGNALANELYGNAGANTLNGGAEADYLVGYGGADSFAFTTALGGGNVDQLADFVSGTDKILLDDAVFSALTGGALPASAFVTGSAAGDADDRIIYNSATGQLFYDADGNGMGAQVLFATLDAHPPLAASDFTVI